ncbi:ArsR/SmtB family transcription factor [Terribacillus halophilus]|jgi:ArsR family transcriptional regulator, arsenate/arsenite/antimonite-responsive transcriptional repressor|uniref:ArsR/SmtB family transcription factor n=1 Tax=Terribacillus halophilus TaxID=361279 RepID=UPI000986FE77|nr:metalloregulator ArsR/SmtB family transcription factor [Terribacillus halophilus]
MATTQSLSTGTLTETLKILHDPTRLLLLKLLTEKEYCVCELVEMFDISQPAVSQHLRKYRQAGLVIEEKRGQWRYYQFDPSCPQSALVKSVLAQLDAQDEQLVQLRHKAEAITCS